MDADRAGLAGTGDWLDRAHSPQAKGRIERFFGTAQDRLVKGYVWPRLTRCKQRRPIWRKNTCHSGTRPSRCCRRAAAMRIRPLRGGEHELAAILSLVEERRVTSDYTIRYQGKIYQIARGDIRPGLRGGGVRWSNGWTGPWRSSFVSTA